MCDSQYKNGGDLVKPYPSSRIGGRRSIHSHERYSPFRENMVRYGVSSRPIPCSSNKQQSAESCDEVDNILSKPQPTSASTHTNNPSLLFPKERRSSLKEYHSDEDSTDSDEEQSSWATLPRSANNSQNSSQDSNRFCTPQSRAENYWNDNSYEGRPPTRQEKNIYSVNPKPLKNSSSSNYIVASCIALIGVLFTVFYYYSQHFLFVPNLFISTTVPQYDETRFTNDLISLGDKYDINDDSILQLKTGIKTIHYKEMAGSFIFVYDSKKTTFDEIKFDKVVNEIASISAKYLRNDSAFVQHLVLDGGRLDMKEHGELIRRYRDDVARRGVMLLRAVDRLPASLAMALHYYCDEYDPLIKRSAIFFTLDLGSCSSYSSQGSIHMLLETCLANKWKGLRQDNIGPLLTRVVTAIIDVDQIV